MMVPWPCWRISRMASCIMKSGAFTLTPKSRSKEADVVSSMPQRSVLPAAFTRTSRRPKALFTAAMARAGRPRSSRSPSIVSTLPVPRRAAALSRSLAPLRSSSITPSNPPSRKRFAAAKPIPCAPPVTSATLPLCMFVMVFSFRSSSVSALGQRLQPGQPLLVVGAHPVVEQQAHPAVEHALRLGLESPGHSGAAVDRHQLQR